MSTSHTRVNTRQSTSAPGGGLDAIELLKHDHEEVKELFEKYEGLSDRSLATKRKVALEICLALSKHAVAEEQVFYPAVRAADSESEDIVDEAIVEHASAKALIAEIVQMAPTEDLYDAKVKVLSEQIEHHVEEEENEMFPKAQDAGLDLMALAEEIRACKESVELPGA